jgi:hypothetical protein
MKRAERLAIIIIKNNNNYKLANALVMGRLYGVDNEERYKLFPLPSPPPPPPPPNGVAWLETEITRPKEPTLLEIFCLSNLVSIPLCEKEST